MGDDFAFMGTLEDAQTKCLAAWKVWSTYRQPYIGAAPEHKKRDVEGREAAVRFNEAAALLCWHLERAQVLPEQTVVDGLIVSLRHAVDIIAKHVPRDALGTNAQGDPEVPGGYQEWPLLDEYLHYMREALAKAEPDSPRQPFRQPATWTVSNDG